MPFMRVTGRIFFKRIERSRSLLKSGLPAHAIPTLKLCVLSFGAHFATASFGAVKYGTLFRIDLAVVLKANGKLISGQWTSKVGIASPFPISTETPSKPHSSDLRGGCTSRITFAPSAATLAM